MKFYHSDDFVLNIKRILEWEKIEYFFVCLLSLWNYFPSSSVSTKLLPINKAVKIKTGEKKPSSKSNLDRWSFEDQAKYGCQWVDWQHSPAGVWRANQRGSLRRGHHRRRDGTHSLPFLLPRSDCTPEHCEEYAWYFDIHRGISTSKLLSEREKGFFLYSICWSKTEKVCILNNSKKFLKLNYFFRIFFWRLVAVLAVLFLKPQNH